MRKPRTPQSHGGEARAKSLSAERRQQIATDAAKVRWASPRRFTPEEDAIIKADYAAYVPTLTIAHKLKRGEGVVRQRLLVLGLHRSLAVSILMRFAPEELRGQVQALGEEAFIEAVYEHRAKEQEAITQASNAEAAIHQQRMDALVEEILADTSLKRTEKMIAMRAAGLTLKAVGNLYGITRERVRQITSPHYIGYLTKGRPRGRPPKAPTAKLERLKNRSEWLEAQVERVNKKRKQIADAQLERLLHAWNNTPLSLREVFLKRVGVHSKDEEGRE